MKREELKLNEVYILTRDVENSKPDRRSNERDLTTWAKHPTIKKGTRFVLRDFRHHFNKEAREKVDQLPVWRYSQLNAFDARFNLGGIVRPGPSHDGDKDYEHERVLFDRIVDALELAPATLEVFFHQHGHTLSAADDLLESMLRHGQLNWLDLHNGFSVLDEDQKRENEIERALPPVIYERPAPPLPTQPAKRVTFAEGDRVKTLVPVLNWPPPLVGVVKELVNDGGQWRIKVEFDGEDIVHLLPSQVEHLDKKD